MAHIRLCEILEIPDPGAKSFELGQGAWPFAFFVVRSDGSCFGYVNQCPHAGHQLNWVGDRFLDKRKRAIQCASHGAVFEIKTGACVAGPCPGESLKPVPLIEEKGVLFVDENIVRAMMPEQEGSGLA